MFKNLSHSWRLIIKNTMKHVLLYILSVFMVTACVPKQKTADRETTLEYSTYHDGKNLKYLNTIGQDTSCVFYNISSFFINSSYDSNMYILDRGDYRLTVMTRNGKPVTTIGGRGEGPGEFISPTFCAACSNYIYVTEQYLPVAHIFDKNYKYVKDVFIELLPCDISIYNNELAIAGVEVYNPSAIQIGLYSLIDDKTTMLKKLDSVPSDIGLESDDQSAVMIWKFVNISCNNKLFYAAYLYQNFIHCFTAEGDRWTTVVEELPHHSSVKNGASMKLPEKKLINCISGNKKGLIFILTGDYSEYKSRQIIILDTEGKKTGELIMNYEAFSVEFVEPDLIYALDIGRIYIHRYKIDIAI